MKSNKNLQQHTKISLGSKGIKNSCSFWVLSISGVANDL